MSVQALQATDPSEIGGHRLLGRIGAGGMGVVYLARSRRRGLLAIKVIRHDPADAEAMERFRREAATLRGLRSPYVAPLVDARVTTPPYWLATAYVRGPTLLRAVSERGPLSYGLCLRLLAGLAAALADVHGHGVQHRDLKPHNVILSPEGPRLIDFGIARSPGQSTITTSGEIVGTPGYIAPEAVRREPITAAADVFALAGTIAYAATGRPPFGRGEPMAVLYSSLNADIDVGGVDPRLAELIGRCAARNPADRITADQVASLAANTAANTAGDAVGNAANAAGPWSWGDDEEYQALVGAVGLEEDVPTGAVTRRAGASWAGRALAAGAVLAAVGATAAIMLPRLTKPSTPNPSTATSTTTATIAPAGATPTSVATSPATPATASGDPGGGVVTQPPPGPAPTGPVRWSAVHGPRCVAEWFYADPAWRPVSGGWKRDGCEGAALALRVGNEPAHFNQGVNWYFDTRGGARCTIDVHIPDDPRSTGLAFYYLDDNNTNAPHLGPPVTVDQRAYRGRWAPLGTWTVPAPGRLTVLVGNQPVKADDTHEVTVSAARARCRW
ncbi:protein kinase [Nonomuraea spiralis]|uniref:Protein kinase n=1 Tax=Nonomuraea spiralis TaxID=46182 RepID=A0ABV5IGG9_9ACTN|nr:serine/threonine-protein kinase [Nonomuraea spiralis]GGS98795.1 hypothetical protein GCM10010176_048500 [Nonomuraea spiralis]